MHKTCWCKGSGHGARQCSHDKLCQMELPPMYIVAGVLRRKYGRSLHAIIIPSPSPQQVLIVERENLQKVRTKKMIYFDPSPNYCIADPYYNITGIAGRACTLNYTSSSHHCDNLCCDHGYETFTFTKPIPCKCKFIWCCKVECEICYTTGTRYRCRDQPDTEVSTTTTTTTTDVEVSSTGGD